MQFKRIVMKFNYRCSSNVQFRSQFHKPKPIATGTRNTPIHGVAFDVSELSITRPPVDEPETAPILNAETLNAEAIPLLPCNLHSENFTVNNCKARTLL